MAKRKYTPFPCEIPEKKPGYADLVMEEAWADMQKRVSARMKKLRTVAAGKEDPDKVAYALRRAFIDDNGHLLTDEEGNVLLDVMTAAEIKAVIKPLLPIVKWGHFARFPNAVAVVNCWFITTKEWELIRAMGFGGSDSAVSMGIHKYESSSGRGMFYSKTRLKLSEPDDAQAFIFQYGHEREPIVIDTFCRKITAIVIPCPFLFRHRKYPWMTANIDAIVQLPNGNLAVFEAKTTSSHAEYDWVGGPPIHYLRQPMQYMAVLDDERIECAYIGAVISNVIDGWKCHRIDRDLAYEEDLINHERDFFERYVMTGIRPSYELDRDKDVCTFFSYEKPESVLLDGEDKELPETFLPRLRQWQALKNQKDALESQLETVTSNLTEIALEAYEEIGDDAKSGYLIDGSTGYMFTVGCQKRETTSVDKDKLRLLYPEAYAACTSTKTGFNAPAIKRKRVPKAKKGG